MSLSTGSSSCFLRLATRQIRYGLVEYLQAACSRRLPVTQNGQKAGLTPSPSSGLTPPRAFADEGQADVLADLLLDAHDRELGPFEVLEFPAVYFSLADRPKPFFVIGAPR